MKKITDSVLYIGVADKEIDLFEGQYRVPDGMAYNSYVIVDEKIAVVDTVDAHFANEWLANVEEACGGRTPDYLIIHHMEPDHSGSLGEFLSRYPGVTLAASAKAFEMIKNFFSLEVSERVVLSEGSELSLGWHNLRFITAPMVHWPEVVMSFDEADGILFSADAFGKFGMVDADLDDWACEARRYYFGIVGKYGAQVVSLLKKAAAFDVKTICPLHGNVLCERLDYYLGLYETWASYRAETRGVAIAYTSVYGNTEKAVFALAAALERRGVKVAVSDLARCDMAEAVEDAFRYDRLVLATTTYNGGVFPFMREFIAHLTERGYRDRTVALVENGSWHPMAAKTMRKMLEECRDLRFAQNTVSITSAVKPGDLERIELLADELAANE